MTGSRPVGSVGGGTGTDAQASITSRTGALPCSTWPVGSTEPVRSAFRRRSSSGSIPSTAASLSIWASKANVTCGAPNPRIAPQGGLFV